MISMEVCSFTKTATPYSIFPPVFARGIVELAVDKGVIFIRGFVEEVKDAGIQKGLFRNSCFVYLKSVAWERMVCNTLSWMYWRSLSVNLNRDLNFEFLSSASALAT
jgi:hypothetical protein